MISRHGRQPFALASVCKLPIAMHLLALVDEGKLTLPGWVSVVAKRWPKQRRFPLDDLFELTVARSDNTAVDTLFRVGGGAPALQRRMRQWKIEGVRVDRPEGQCFLEAGLTNIPRVEQYTPALFSEDFKEVSQETRRKMYAKALRAQLSFI